MEILNKSSLHPTIFSRNDAYALLMTKDLFFSTIYLNVCVSCWEMIGLDCGCTPHMTLFQTFCLVVDIYEWKTDIKSKRLVKNLTMIILRLSTNHTGLCFLIKMTDSNQALHSNNPSTDNQFWFRNIADCCWSECDLTSFMSHILFEVERRAQGKNEINKASPSTKQFYSFQRTLCSCSITVVTKKRCKI